MYDFVYLSVILDASSNVCCAFVNESFDFVVFSKIFGVLSVLVSVNVML